jgi:inositol transport system ATP-binding protein
LENEIILEMKNISKTFPGVKALDNVQLTIHKGCVHALMGENGAGKSTLMKILIGLQPPDAGGKIYLKGKEVQLNSTKDALNYKISMIHQELSPVPYMTIAENIFLGREAQFTKGIFVDQKKMNRKTEELLEELEITLNPKTQMRELSIANTQMVEIAKAISYGSELIIMDEPTSAITEKEVGHLFKIINKLKAEGTAIIYISHKMEEIFKICDEITVFRDGMYIGTDKAEDLNEHQLIQMMVGRELNDIFHREKSYTTKNVMLEVKNLSRKGIFQNINFRVYEGEILGFAGLMGAGRTEVMESIFGITKPDSGEVYIKGEKAVIRNTRDAKKYKMAMLTEDRKLTGCFLPLSVADNIGIACLEEYMSGPFVNPKKLQKESQKMREQLRIKTPSVKQLINNLSGGNQQKVLLARWLETEPEILIIDEPTRGIDIGAKSEIYKILVQLAKEGKTIIVISSEMQEIIGLCDRTIVMQGGHIAGELSKEEVSQEKIMALTIEKMGEELVK